ncbi:MAG: glycerophosphodiester phosphodiesterase [Promethearchaeota archaeon]
MLILNPKKFYVIGHRGSEAEAPENSIPSFAKCMEYGIDFIETDVQITKDGKFILFHDKYLNSKTNGKGKIKKYNLDQLKKFKYTYFKNTTPNLCSLENLLLFIRKREENMNSTYNYESSKKVKLIIELKGNFSSKNIIDLLKLIEKYNFFDRIIIDSFNLKNLITIRKNCENVFISWLYKRIPSHKFKKINIKALKKIEKLIHKWKINAISYHKSNLIPSIIEFWKQNNILIFGWGIKNPREYKNYIKLAGLNGFTASDPRLLLNLRKIEFGY